MKRFLKVLHQLGSVGLMGGYGTVAILVATLPATPADAAAVLAGVAQLCAWLLFPSMLLTVLSGLLGIAAHLPFSEAPWVWLKALLGVVVFEATLQLQSYARGTAQVAGELAAGEGDPALLEVLKRSLGLALWVLLLVSLAQVVLGVWRPRIRLPGSAPVAPPAP